MQNHDDTTLEEMLDKDLNSLRTNGEFDEVDELIDDDEIIDTDDASAYNNFKEDGIIFSPQIEVFEPFAAHVDASRTNMSAKQLLQTVTSDNNELPFILNKNYVAMVGIDSPFVEYAKEDGIVLYSNFNFLIIYYLVSNSLETIYCPSIKRMTNNTITLKYKLDTKISKRFKAGDMLFDYSGQTVDGFVPRIGYRTSIMYGSFYGYTADDAFVMSESFAERATIDYSKKIFIPITKEIKYLKNCHGKYIHEIGDISDENFLSYFKIDSSDSFLSEFNNTSQQQSKIFGKDVDSIDGGVIKDVKVHRITKETFDDLENQYIYTPGLIREIKKNFERQLQIKKDIFTNLNSVFHDDQAVTLANKIFSEWESAAKFPLNALEIIAQDYKIEKETIDYILEIEIYKSEPTCVGDKFANVYAGKGVCSLIVPDELMPKDENGKPADIIFNPLGLFGRNNWGTIFEIGLAKIVEDIQNHIDNKQDTINRIEFIRQNFICKYDESYSDKILTLLYSFEQDENYVEFVKSVIKNGFYLFVDNFPGITFKRFIDEFIIPYQEKYSINITGKTKTKYSKELMTWMRDRGFVSNVFETSTQEDVDQEVYFGKNYWIKLFHTSHSKYNAIGFANSYSKSTGEPPRGRTKNGGCHISWQTTAALEGHKENNSASKELRTIKSDAVNDKTNFNRKMIKDGEYIMKDKYKSPTVNTLNNALNMLCLKFSSIYDNNDESSFDSNVITQEAEVFNIDDLFTGVTSDYERSDNLDLVIDDEETSFKFDPETGEIIEDSPDIYLTDFETDLDDDEDDLEIDLDDLEIDGTKASDIIEGALCDNLIINLDLDD